MLVFVDSTTPCYASRESADKPEVRSVGEMAAVRAPCFFFQRGFCRNGSDCRFAHVVVEGAAAEVCGICFDDVKTRYGLLTGCEHAFCLECIRQWRCRAGGEHEPGIEARNSNKRTCPIVR